jgi:4-alpha-glucanotransferase
MVTKKTWKEFRENGFLWWINMILHTFGWAIVIDIDDNGEIIDAYPARVKFRGFDEKNNTEGYIKVSQYMKENVSDLLEEAEN